MARLSRSLLQLLNLAQIETENVLSTLSNLVSLRLLLPLFPARTHADCSSNYKMEESPAKPEERPNGEAGRPQDASPWGVGRGVMVYPMTPPRWVGKTKKREGGSRDLCALPL